MNDKEVHAPTVVKELLEQFKRDHGKEVVIDFGIVEVPDCLGGVRHQHGTDVFLKDGNGNMILRIPREGNNYNDIFSVSMIVWSFLCGKTLDENS